MAKKLSKVSTKQPISKEKKKATTSFLNRKYAFEILIFAFSFLLFANTIPNDYNMDDELVTMNHRLTSKGISAIPEIFTSPYYEDASGYSYEYRPVVLTSFAIEHDIFGENPHWGHFWNVILYGLTCVLLYRVLKLLFKDYSPIIAIAVSLLFVAHPSHTEVVCSIKNRDEILGLLFSLLAFNVAIKSVQEKNNWLLILVPIFFILSLLSKLTLSSFIPVILLAILLFSEFDFSKFLFISFSLILSFFCVSDFGSTLTKLIIVFTSFVLSFILFFIKRPSNLTFNVGLLKKRLFNIDRFSIHEEPPSAVYFSAFFSQSIPNFQTFPKKFAVINLILIAIFIIGVYNDLIVFQLFSSFVLAFFYFEKDENKKLVVTFSSLIIILLRYNFFSGYDKSLHVFEIFTVIIIYNLLFGKRAFLVPYLVSLMVLFIITITTNDSVLGKAIFAISIVFITNSLRSKFGIIFIAISWILTIMNVIMIYTSSTTGKFSEVIGSLMFIALSTSIYYKMQHWIVSKIYFVSLLIFPLLLAQNKMNDKQLLRNIQNNIEKLDTKIIDKGQNRPINYVENCIDYIKTPLTTKVGTSLEILLHYFTKTILPNSFSFYYGFSFIKPMKITETIPLISLIAHFALLFLGLFYLKKDKLLAFGIFLYLFSIAIFSNIFQPVPGMLADRFLLVPSLGWLIGLVAIIARIFKLQITNYKLQEVSKPARFVFAMILLFYSTLTFSRNLQWKNHLTLFEHDISYVDNSAQAHNILALRLMKESFNEGMESKTQLEYRKQAAIHFRRAIEIYPPFFNANYDLGRTYQVLGHVDSAIYFYKKTVLLDSTFVNASLTAGELLLQQNKAKEAIPFFRSVIAEFPTDFTGYDKLSYALFLEKEYTRSIDVLNVANEKLPQNSQPRICLAKLYYNTNKIDSAKFWLQQALKIEPNNQEAKGLLQNLENK